jgi:DNA polymerase-3 subunit delta'
VSAVDSISAAVAQLRQSLAAGRLAHGYLVHGPVRSAGCLVLEQFLPTLFCQAKDKPCGECAECRRVAAHEHPDILRLEPESKSRLIVIGEDEEEGIRKVVRFISLTPFIGPWKVCVILDADRMNEAAANALLKTLEEPPPASLLFLLAESPQALPPTVISRCQRLVVSAGEAGAEEPWRAPLLEWLRAGPAAEPLQASVRAGQLGFILDAERERVTEAEEEAAKEWGAEKDVIAARVGARYRAVRSTLLKALLLWHRDVLLRVLQVETGGFHYAAEAEAQRRQAAGLTPAAALADVRRLEKLIGRLDQFPEASESALLGAGLPQRTK